MPWFLGIDGGGSKTNCLLGDERNVLASAGAAGSNPIRVGEARSRQALQAAVREVCALAQVQPSQLTRTCVGMAGAARPQVEKQVRAILADLVGGEIEVAGDMVIALEAAFRGAPGLIVIAGTGSIAYGRNERGETARAGGWGFAISDEGSGHWIGRAAVAAAMRAHDLGENSVLVSSIMNTWHLGSREDVVRAANAIPPPDFAELFPQVLAAAAGGDSRANEILTQAATELAQLARIVADRLWRGRQGFRVAISGGVFQNAPLVRQVFCNSLRSLHPQAEIDGKVVEPAQGALWLARKNQ
ncbi:MAG TPA: BadF/BadG/BcrA/BcrD ATPase family protein [Terriglobales bacterium]|nr:BadF/BadG/BcrA/BcrD ATPase family protein [Terriglobales bacterium]